ncbi:hypothetical protein LTR10_021100 [Elasticomyces elasticus]|uniref:Altered inheritance of mitochondria protein 41 n=1 Tax=Exophiala sideris TaxID=1016849 RepID=A0ABR0J6H4_9EURO|nr:hypothetical protein LTR10_021100 [Elasticomyces elasticus]KAK5028897.1 hypothetical protein LTS07_006278 [Exophiala sideris]KAK5035766.1 hypothetical protein LTR13_005897 [Exophiala sideris]KAK5057401.1 hypothetical protein LTR69_007442 [Exophiala sideris]KAK5181623.1 hypothetical protein LTR44_005822 [Eurotiomycetes sp. CCFEE 6388]
MSSARTIRSLPLSERSICSRCLYRNAITGLRWSSTSSTSAPASPLLAKLKNDLKSAMRAKDTARLNVIRGTISEINRAASGPSPIQTDMQILALLRKRKGASEQAKKEAKHANRADLAEKEDKELVVLDELTSSVQLMAPEEMRKIVRAGIESLRSSTSGELKPGPVLKELLKPGGDLADEPLDKKVLAELVREELAQ